MVRKYVEGLLWFVSLVLFLCHERFSLLRCALASAHSTLPRVGVSAKRQNIRLMGSEHKSSKTFQLVNSNTETLNKFQRFIFNHIYTMAWWDTEWEITAAHIIIVYKTSNFPTLVAAENTGVPYSGQQMSRLSTIQFSQSLKNIFYIFVSILCCRRKSIAQS